MPGEWDIAGSFIQGIMARKQHDQQMQVFEQQKTLLDQQKKELAAKELLANAENDRKIKAGEEWQQVMSLIPGFSGQPGGEGAPATPQGEMPQMGIPQLMAIEKLAKETGNINPFAIKEYQTSIVNPETGGPQTVGVGQWGNIIKKMDEYRKPIDYIQTTEEGGRRALQLQPGTTLEGGGMKGIVPLSPASAKENQKEVEYIDATGATWKKVVNATTGEDVPNIKPWLVGISPKQTAEAQTAGAGGGARAIMEQLNSLIDQMDLGESLLEKTSRGAELTAGAFAGTNEPAVLYQSLVGGSLGPIIRSLGEKGALSDSDVKRAFKLIPSFYTSKTIAKNQLKQILDIIHAAGGTQKGKPSLKMGPQEVSGPSILTAEEYMKKKGFK